MLIIVDTPEALGLIPVEQREKATLMYGAWQAARELRTALDASDHPGVAFVQASAAHVGEVVPDVFSWDCEKGAMA